MEYAKGVRRIKMKKALSIVISFIFLFLFCSCSQMQEQSKKINIVAIGFAEYDFTRQIIKDSDRANVDLLIQDGVDIHSYQPSAKDIASIVSADLLIYTGGESDYWVQEVIDNNALNDSMSILCLSGVIEDRLLKIDEHHNEYDEHIYLSLKNAKEFVTAISKEIISLDKTNEQLYQNNTNQYIKSISELDDEYTQSLKNFENKEVVFADRFAFRYLFNDYNLDYCAAFEGCGAESEVSFDTVTHLAKCVDKNNLKNILILENSNDQLAKTVIDSTKSKSASVLQINSMQSVTNLQQSYLDIMRDNLLVLLKGLDTKGE